MPDSHDNPGYIFDLRVLITGGAGFIGSHLSQMLLESGATVAALDNFDEFYPRLEKERNLNDCRNHPRFQVIEGDIRDGAALDRHLAEFRPDIIVHLAARAGVRPSIEQPELYADVNVRGTAVLLESARRAGLRNLVFASSSSVYGNSKSMPLREADRTDNQISPYGATKKAGELLCHTFHTLYAMNIACLRFFTVYGPRQRPDLAIRKFVHLALTGEEIPVFGDGSSKRDYTHITDIVSGVTGAIRWVQAPQSRFGIFNLGSSSPISMSDLLKQLQESIGKQLRIRRLPFQPGDVYQTYADSSVAENELGFKHDIRFDDGLRDFVKWMKSRSV